MSEKEKQRKRLFLVNDRECFTLSHFTFVCFFSCQTCKCGQLSHSYIIKHDLGKQIFSSTTIVMPLFSWTNSVVHIFKLRLQDCGCIPQVVTSSHIHTCSYSYLKKVLIGRVLNLLFDSTGEIWDFHLELSGVIWANMSLRSGSNASLFI